MPAPQHERRRFPLAWITGAGGLIGNYLADLAMSSAPGWQVRPLVRGELDLADTTNVCALFRQEQPDAIFHCAALSRSPDCQANPRLAYRINVEATRVLCELAGDMPLIFFSSDLVFDGRTGNYSEGSPVNPLSVYAETKVAAEQIVLSNPRHFVIRTSLNGGTSPAGDRGFNEQIRNAWQAGETLRLFTDEYRCPLHAGVTARAAWELLEKNQPGLYHFAGSERLSRWQIGELLARRWPQLNPKIVATSLKEYKGAPRSPDTSLNSTKAQKLLSFRILGLTDWLAAHPNEVF
jgi:dTDP-4-dehydrorhamnose reductase